MRHPLDRSACTNASVGPALTLRRQVIPSLMPPRAWRGSVTPAAMTARVEVAVAPAAHAARLG